jgi:PAS domain S-box-containing protein
MAAADSSSQELFDIVDRLPAPAMLADDDGLFVHANAAACSLLSVASGAILGRTIAEFVARPFDVGEAWESFRRTGSLQGELELHGGDGATIPVHFSAVRNFGERCHLSILTDLGPRKRIESILRRSEELYARAFNMTPAPTNVRKLGNGVFVDVNVAFTEVLGYWRSDVVGRTAESIGLWADPALLAGILAELREGTEVVRTRARLVTKSRDQREFSVAVRRAEIFGEPHAVAVYTDLAAL